MSAGREFTERIVDGALDMVATAALMNGRGTFDLTDKDARSVAAYIATGTIAYLNHLAEMHGAEAEIGEFYRKVAEGMSGGVS